MRLRLRLALTILAATVPLAAATVYAAQEVERRHTESVLREFAVTRMESGGRERCEARPETFPRPPPRPPAHRRGGPFGQGMDGEGPFAPGGGFEGEDARRPRGGARSGPPGEGRTLLWAYGDDLVSANPDAPAMPEDLAAAMRAGDDVAVHAFAGDEFPGHEGVVRMAWTDSPCAFVLVRRTGPQPSAGPQDLWWAGAVLGGGALLAVLLAVGPVLRRIRGLESDVRRSAEERYARPVEVSGSDEVADLARAFNDAGAAVREHLSQVEERETTLRRFVANTTHDLMTPLTVLQGHLDALRGRLDESDGETREAILGGLREVDYTTSLVANLTAAAKLEAGDRAVERHDVDLNALVGRVVGRYRPVARAHGVEINVGVPEGTVATAGDVTLLEQAVSNVVQNAVRYNHRGGHVAVLLRSLPGPRFEIRVVDDGPGIDEEQRAQLTDRGFRGGEARARSPTGDGIGLDITRSVCGRHAIELAFDVSEHGGLAVTLRGAALG